MTSLAGILAKLDRAEESIELLNKERVAFLMTEPLPYHVEGGFFDDPTKYEFRGYQDRPVPLRFSILAGEIIHQLRSCFDHLIGELAAANGQPPIRNHEFPICTDREKFRKAIQQKVKGISRSALRRIVKAQPYRQATPDTTTINLIHQWDIIDKHRLLLVVGKMFTLGNEVEVGTTEPEGPTPEIIKLTKAPQKVLSEQGHEIFSITLSQPVPDFEAKGQFHVHLVFGEEGPAYAVEVISTLRTMAAFTRKFISSFKDELGA